MTGMRVSPAVTPDDVIIGMMTVITMMVIGITLMRLVSATLTLPGA